MERESQELEPVGDLRDAGLGFGDVQPDVGQDVADQAIGSLNFPASIRHDDEVVVASGMGPL